MIYNRSAENSCLKLSISNQLLKVHVFLQRHDEDIWEPFFPSLISLFLCSDTLQQPGCIIACKKLHTIFISDRKLKRTSDSQYLSCMNFTVSPKVMNKSSEHFATLTPPTSSNHHRVPQLIPLVFLWPWPEICIANQTCPRWVQTNKSVTNVAHVLISHD